MSKNKRTCSIYLVNNGKKHNECGITFREAGTLLGEEGCYAG